MMASSTTKPSIIALIVCDNIYVEPGGKLALVGLFNNISAREFPASHSRLAVFVSVTDLRPNSKGRLEIVHSETDQNVVHAEGAFGKEVSPLTVFDMNFLLKDLVFPDPGAYFIRFWVNEHLLVQRPFNVVQTPRKGRKKP